MFRKNVVKSIACVVIVVYLSVFNASSLLAAEGRLSVNPQLFAQAATALETTEKATPEEENALRQIYNMKVQRLEAEMNNAKGTRNTLLTVSVASFFVGAGVMAGSSSIKSALEDIPTTEQENKDDALQALDTVNAVGAGIIGVGGLSLLGYFIYTGNISGKQHKIDTLRTELDARYQAKGLTPEYLQKNESVAAVIQEMNDAKKSAGSSRTFQGFFSKVGISSLLSGGFLFGLSKLGHDIIEETSIDETDPEQVAAKNDGLDETDKIGTTGLILVGAGGVCEIASFIFGRKAASKEHQIDELENSLLRVAERIDIQPTFDGFRMMYTYNF